MTASLIVLNSEPEPQFLTTNHVAYSFHLDLVDDEAHRKSLYRA